MRRPVRAPGRGCPRGRADLTPARRGAERCPAPIEPSGPAVSWLAEIGTMPVRLTRPIVGFNPTMPQAPAGQLMEPSVSVPSASGARPAATPAPEPGRRTAGAAVESERVPRLPSDGAPPARGRPPTHGGPFRQVGLSDDDGAGLPEEAYDWSICRRRVPVESQRAGCRAERPGRVDVVLHEHGYAVEGTEWPA